MSGNLPPPPMYLPQIASSERSTPGKSFGLLAALAVSTLLGTVPVAFGGANPLPARPAAAVPVNGSARLHPSTRSNQSCSQCHEVTAGMSHPVDVRPSMTVPEGLPLEGGHLVCTTCHEADPAGKPLDSSLLRDIGSRLICSQCHTQVSGQGRSEHAGGMLKAHSGQGMFGNSRGHSDSRGLDDESRECMSCHDGNFASDAGRQVAGGGLELETSREHPVGVEYRPGKPMSELRLKPAERLDPRVRLFDGVVGCGSCHSVYSKQPGLLVKNNVRSELCMSCHEQ